MTRTEALGVSTNVSGRVELSCHSPSPWFFCVWEGPLGERVCALKADIDKGQGTLCGVSTRLEITGVLSIQRFNFG